MACECDFRSMFEGPGRNYCRLFRVDSKIVNCAVRAEIEGGWPNYRVECPLCKREVRGRTVKDAIKAYREHLRAEHGVSRPPEGFTRL